MTQIQINLKYKIAAITNLSLVVIEIITLDFHYSQGNLCAFLYTIFLLRCIMHYNTGVCVHAYLKSSPAFCDSTDFSLPGSSVHGIFQARILNWVAISYSRGSSWSRDRIHVPCMGRRILYHHATWENPLLRPCKQTKTKNWGKKKSSNILP